MMTEEEKSKRLLVAQSFMQVETIADLAKLMNEVWSFLCGGKCMPIPLREITYFGNYKLVHDAYRTFFIPKKNGKTREIQAPNPALRRLQVCLNFIFSSIFVPNSSACGFVLGKHVGDAARPHIRMPYVFHIDLEDFFPSISLYRIKACLTLPPFNLSDEKEKIAYCIANICCISREGRAFLPQGAPTSPILSNVVCQRLDRKLKGLAKRFGAQYSRYADDITFSSYINVFQEGGEFREELNRIIYSQKFAIQSSKTRLESRGFRQTVCGLVINEKVNVSKKFVRTVRVYLYFWKQYGYERAQMLLETDLRRTGREHIPELRNYLAGKLRYMQMIKGADDGTYQKLYDTFQYLNVLESIPDLVKLENSLDDFQDALTKSSMDLETMVSWYSRLTDNIDWKILAKTKWGKKFADCQSILLKKISVAGMHKQQEVAKESHDARLLPRFLYNHFSKSDPLKFITHSWDTAGNECKFTDLIDFRKKVSDNFKEISKTFNQINRRLFACFYGFLYGSKEGWGQYNIKCGWNSVWLEKWCMENPARSPFDCPIPEKERPVVKERKLNYFIDVVDVFKSEFQFRLETKQMKMMLRELKIKFLNFDFNVTIECGDVKLYTNVSLVYFLLSKILFVVSQRKQYPDIIIKVDEQNEAYVDIIICQQQSEYYSTCDSLKKEVESGDFCEWKDAMKNICDWSVEAQCRDGAYRIWYLNSYRQDEVSCELLDSVAGFTHRLRFYKHYGI